MISNMSDDTIRCPSCQAEIKLTQALKKQLEQQLIRQQQARFQQQIKQLQDSHQRKLEEMRQQWQDQFAKQQQVWQERFKRQLQSEYELRLKTMQEEAQQQAKQNQQLKQQLLEYARMKRELEQKQQDLELELERRLAESQKQIANKIRQQLEEQTRLKMMEKEKQLQDAIKANEALRRKLEQGSQQTQGEVLEQDLEEQLRQAFAQDQVNEVPKGIRGADIIQTVCDKQARVCGTIVWELKNTKAFSPSWIGKLKHDQRQLKAELAVLVSKVVPDQINHFGQQDGIWITTPETAVSLAAALRLVLIQTFHQRQQAIGKEEKMEVLYAYLTGTEFKQRVEAMAEAFGAIQQEIEKERRYFQLKWRKQEQQLRQVLDNIYGMYGDLQGIVGKSLPEISGLELPEDSSVEAETAKQLSLEQE